MSEAPNMMKAACWYARHGMPVFPCQPRTKVPLTAHGFKDATTDQTRITECWRECPDANIGIPTGAVSGFVVVDIDPRHGGDITLDELRRQHGAFPDTAEQMTGGGGRHIVFRYSGCSVPKALAPGIDLKGDGGYVVVAPSIHPNGNPYKWDGIEGPKALLHPAEIPAWLLERILAPRNGSLRADPDAAKWPLGERNNRLTSVAGTMNRRGMSREAIEAALLEENRRRCEPPLPEAEVRGIAASIARYTPANETSALGGENVQHAAHFEAWPELIPFAQHEPDVIPVRCLPAWLGDMARATAENTETPFALPALLAVAVASATVSAKAVVSPESGYSEPLNLYTCPAMESGNRKTAVLIQLLAPFTEWESEKTAEIEPERRRLASERRTIESRIDRLRKKAGSAADSKDLVHEIQQLEAGLPDVPPLPRLHVDDCTPERLASLMAEQGGRMAVFSDEGGVFDLIAGRYSKGVPNLDLWLKGHSVSPVRVDRADRARPPILLDRPHLTVGLSPQPDVLASLQDKPGFRGRGLLARFFYGLPKSPLGYRTLDPHPVPSDVAHRYRTGIRELLKFAPEKEIQLRLSTAAYREWKDFQRTLEIEFREGGKLHGLTDWGSKLAGGVLRLAGVFHAVELVGRIAVETEISIGTMMLALEFGALLISHARAVFALMERHPDVEHAEKLVSWIIRQGQPAFTVRDCFRAHQGRFERVDAMLSVLLLLERHGYIRREQQESQGGRKPSDICQVNPAVLKREEVT